MKTEQKKFNKIYESDASQIKGKCEEVIFPETVEEIKKIVKTSKKFSIRGGGTGLVGGAVPQNKDTIIDLSKLIKIENLDKERKTIEVEPGVILDDLQEYLEKFNLEFPINPSSHAVATIGGMIATNAVGSRAIKHGRTSQWIKWIEVVNCRGELTRKGVTELSDYLGMEGITGIIVRACLKLTELKNRTMEIQKFNDLPSLVEKTKNLKRIQSVSMIEFIDREISKGIGLDETYHLLIEYEDDWGNLKDDDYRKTLSLRDSIYPSLSSKGFVRIEDPKILLEKFETLASWFESKKIPFFGHISVGILHPCFNKEQEKNIPEMMKLVKRLGGQISGEHGIGLLKKQFIEPNDKKILVNVKKRTDSLNKFNVGKVI